VQYVTDLLTPWMTAVAVIFGFLFFGKLLRSLL